MTGGEAVPASKLLRVVMAGLVPAIHVLLAIKDPDARDNDFAPSGLRRIRRRETGTFAHSAASRYIPVMTLSDLESAVAKLQPDDLARFRAWFERFDAARFDEKIERDVKAGKLDQLAEAALDDLRNGRTREL
jgi:hypothetical protein